MIKIAQRRLVRSCLILIIPFLTTSCVSYAPSIPEGYQGPLAFVQDTATRIDDGAFDLFYLTAIDGRGILNSYTRTQSASSGMGNRLLTRMHESQVQAGQRTLTLVGRTAYAMPARAWTSTVFEVTGDVEIVLEETVVYEIKGELGEESSKVWIEEHSSGRVLGMVEVEGRSTLGFFEK